MKCPNLWRLDHLMADAAYFKIAGDSGEMMPLRPVELRRIHRRVKRAWLVFTGRADAVIWPGGQ